MIALTRAFSQNQDLSDSLKHVLELNSQLDDSSYSMLLNSIVDSEGRPEIALTYAYQLIDLSRKRGDKRQLLLAVQDVHLLHRQLGNVSQATKYYIEAITISKEIGTKDDLATIYAQEASLLMLEGQYQKAVEEYRKSQNIYQELKDTLMINVIRVNLGETYRLYEKYDSASFYLKQALSENYSSDDIVEGYGSGNLGMVYFAQGEYDTAKRLLEKSITILEPLGDVYSVAVYTFELGKVFTQLDRQKEGEAKMLAAYDTALKEGLKEQVRDFSHYLSKYFQQQKSFERALFYQTQFKTYQDSIINIENVRKVEQLRTRSEVEQRETEINYLSRLNKSRLTTLWAVGSGSVVLLILSSILYRSNQQRKRINVALEQREKEKALLLDELNHRTKNNLNMISSLLNLQADNLGDAAAEAVRQGRFRVDSLAMIHQKLYSEDYASLAMRPYLTELLEHLIGSFDPAVVLKHDITPVTMDVEHAIPLALIINELVTNALKYGKAKKGNTILKVRLQADENQYLLSVSDNGTGMEPPNMDDLTSFGLKLIYALAGQLNGTVNFSNNNGAHWKVTFGK